MCDRCRHLRKAPVVAPVGTGRDRAPRPGLPASYPGYLKPIPINTRDVGQVLRDYLAPLEAYREGAAITTAPQVVRLLYSSLTADEYAPKYQELRNVVRDYVTGQPVESEARYLDAVTWANAQLASWREQYATMIHEVLHPLWEAAAATGGRLVEAGINEKWAVESLRATWSGQEIAGWIEQHGGELVTNLTERQHAAVTDVLRYYTVDRPVGTEELARRLRGVIGLTQGQANAVTHYRQELYTQVQAGELPLARAETLAGNYEGRLHRRRAKTIAQHETAEAFNAGQVAMVEQADEQGLFGDDALIEKVWETMEDERVCETCGPLDQQAVATDEPFPNGGGDNPPAHVGCRCTVTFKVSEKKPIPVSV